MDEPDFSVHPVTIDADSRPGWLIKLPTTIAESWKDARKGTVLATITKKKTSSTITIPKAPILNDPSVSESFECVYSEKPLIGRKIFLRNQDGTLTWLTSLTSESRMNFTPKQTLELSNIGLKKQQAVAPAIGKTRLDVKHKVQVYFRFLTV